MEQQRFLQYITGQEWVAWHAKTYPYTLLARYEERNQGLKPDRNLEPFYALKSNTNANKPMNQLSEEGLAALSGIIERETNKVLQEALNPEQEAIQEQGQAILFKVGS